MIVIIASVLFIIALGAVYILFSAIQLALYDKKDDLLISADEARNFNRNKKQIIAELKWINKKILKRASHGYTHYFNLDVNLHQETIDELKKKGYNVQTSKLCGYNLISWKE